jgi:hypothetical protein
MSIAQLHQASLKKDRKTMEEEKPKCTFLRRESPITKIYKHLRIDTLKCDLNR